MRKIAAALVLFGLCSPLYAQSRTIVSSNLTVYVAPPTACTPGHYGNGGPAVTACGNDVSGDGTQSAPWATCQRAVQALYSQYDFQGLYAPTIQLASANSPAQFYYPLCKISGRLLGQPGSLPPLVVAPGKPNFDIGNYNPFVIQGDTSYPLGAFIVSGDFGFLGDGPAFSLTDGASMKVLGLSFDSGAVPQDCIDVMHNSLIDISNIEWGACGSGVENIGLGVAFNSSVIISGALTVSSGNMGALFQTGQNSNIYPNNNGQSKINIAFGGGAFHAAAFVNGGNSVIYIDGLSFSGSFTGNGLVDVESSTVENATGTGPNTCPSTMILSAPLLIQDHSVCR